jgi:hypothetical protein
LTEEKKKSEKYFDTKIKFYIYMHMFIDTKKKNRITCEK